MKDTSLFDADVQEDAWTSLKHWSKARIALGHVGGSLPLREVLAFRHAHATAKDAIYSELEMDHLKQSLEKMGVDVFALSSKINNRAEYLKRPDLGRQLSEEARNMLEGSQTFDLVFVVTDGLSAAAVNQHVRPVLQHVLSSVTIKYRVAIALVTNGRVAIGDPIGQLLKARFVATFIGERPGLSSPNSMGIYTTYMPEVGLTDERRNCISNIHNDGLSYVQAADLLKYLVTQSFRLKISGVALKVNVEGLKE